MHRVVLPGLALLFAGAIADHAHAQLPPLSPAAGFCPAPASAPQAAGGGMAQATGEPRPALPGPVFDQAMGSGENYAIAEFRLWYPEDIDRIRAILVLTPGSNGDGRNQVMDPVWEAFAVEHGLALVGVRLRDHQPGIFEQYVDVGRGSGDAFLGALEAFARESGRPELATAPFLLWGMSAGGEFNYEMALWKPERTVAFIVNKGGIYWHALASPEARAVPGIFFAGGQDLDSRIGTIFGLFALNRRGGALWSVSVEPCAGHVVGKSQALSMHFYEDMLAARLEGVPLNPDGTPQLRTLTESSGLVGNISTFEVEPAGERVNTSLTTSWLPNERIARGWRAIATGGDVVP